jgi:hypothetical protein
VLPPRTLLTALLAVVALAASAAAAEGRGGSPPGAIRVGGPSAPDESKVAIVGSRRSLAGRRFSVRAADGGGVVLRGKLRRAPGRAAPWRHAYAADLSRLREPGSYVVRVGRLRSRPWSVRPKGSRQAIDRILDYFVMNRDGYELSEHSPSHLNDALIHPDSPVYPGARFDLTGGWMDAGDMLHFTQTTAFVTSLLEASARLEPDLALPLESEADVGLRWLLKAHPAPGLFIAQVGDERDHMHGFRDPGVDDHRTQPGIGQRFAYPEIGGDLSGKAATALALGYLRTGDEAMLDAARDWYEAGKAAARPARALRRAGYPGYAADFYVAPNWKDSMASGAAELFRASCAAGSCDRSFEDDFVRYASDVEQSGPYAAMGAVDDFASFGEAEVCGAFGDPAPFGAEARRLGCRLLAENGRIARRQARRTAFGMPGYFSWGTTAQNGAAGALAALATVAPGAQEGGCRVAAGARDWLLGRNPQGASFIVGYGPRAPKHTHHWAFLLDGAKPLGAVVGGPAPLSEIRSQGFKVRDRFGTRRATYEDRRVDYVTSEPAIDYSASSILLLAALNGRC